MPIDPPITQEELLLLTRYRKATPVQRNFIDRVLSEKVFPALSGTIITVPLMVTYNAKGEQYFVVHNEDD